MKQQFKIFPFIILIFGSLFTNAQDFIVKQNSDEIEAKILEIGTSEIKYKLFTYQDGPTFILNKSEIFYIKYSNGTKEIVTPLGTTPAIQNTPNSSGNTVINNNNRSFPDMNQPLDMMNQNGYIYQNGMFVSETALMSALKTSGKSEIAELFSLSKKYNFSRAFFGVGIPLIGIGLFGIVYQGISFRGTGDIGDQLAVAGSITAFTGAALLTTGIFINTSRKTFRQKAMIAYNEGLTR